MSTGTSPAYNQLSNALADRYRIERELGAGGMATVYLAQDLRHERQVAIKVLKPELAAVLGADRFIVEIKTTAGLQHPHILPLFDSGSVDGMLYYVMPYLEGETVRDKLNRETQFSVDEAVRIAREVADALDYAHRRGVIHRDIKPENILLHDGRAMVMDFGIALAVSAAAGGRMTETGLSLGTPHYMSPEQATADRDLSARSDIYSLGTVLYEMLAGNPPHTGASAQQIIMKIITEPAAPVTTLRKSVPAHVTSAIARAIEKVPADRFETAKAFSDALVNPSFTHGVEQAAALSTSRRNHWRTIAIACAGVAIAAVLAAFTLWLRPTTVGPDQMYRLSLDASDSPHDQLLSVTISPDGQRLAMVLRDSSGITALWLRSLDAAQAARVPGSEGAVRAFFSPDGEQLGLITDSRLLRLNVRDMRPELVVDNLAVGRGPLGAWMADDQILFSTSIAGRLMRVSARGGNPVPVRPLAKGELGQGIPLRLADNRHYLFRVATPNAAQRFTTFVGSLDSPDVEPFLPEPVIAVTAGAAIVQRQGTLMAVALDKKGTHVRGDPVPLVAEDGIGGVAASRDGLLVYQRGNVPTGNRLQILDRTGQVVSQIGEHADGQGYDFYGPRVSPDGKKIAYESHEGRGSGDLFIYDVSTGKVIRQTFLPDKHSAFAAWSPDSRTMIFESTRDGTDLYKKTLDGSVEQKLPRASDVGFPTDWSPDGASVFFAKPGEGGFDVFRTSPSGGAVEPVLTGPGNQINAVLSPDGKWIAYASDEQGGRSDVYVRRYPLTAEQWQVSKDGGEAPRWARDGKTLYFLARLPSVAVMSTPVTLGTSFVSGEPKLLFRKSIRLGIGVLVPTVNYDVTSNGQFIAVVMDSLAQTRPPSIGVLMNWTSKVLSAKR